MDIIETERLYISLMNTGDAAFMMELMNTQGWLTFIGDRNIRTLEAARLYVQAVLDRDDASYYIVRTREDHTPAGVLSFLQRTYLPGKDLGFAFLPSFQGKGYALESASALLDTLKVGHERILATAFPGNSRSIRLLELLGFRYHSTFRQDETELHLYEFFNEQDHF